MDNRFKQQTVAMVDKHLTTLRNNMVASVEAQRSHTIVTLQGEYDQMVVLEKQIEAAAARAIEDLNRVMSKNVSTIHMTLSNVMAPITERKLALYNKLSEFDTDRDEDTLVDVTAEVIKLPAPKKNSWSFRRKQPKVKAAHG